MASPPTRTRSGAATAHSDPQVQIRVPADLLARLEAQCDRLMVGRNLVIVRSVEHVVRFLESRPDPFAEYLDDAEPAPAEIEWTAATGETTEAPR